MRNSRNKSMKSDSDEVRINQVLGSDVLENVFLRLSVKSVGRCRCVCKSWYYSLTDSTFINDIHLNCTLNRHPLQFLLGMTNRSKYSYCIFRFIDAYKNYVRKEETEFKFRFKEGEHKGRKICCFPIGSCNGLVCLDIRFGKFRKEIRRNTIALWNPVTSEYKIAPLTPSVDESEHPLKIYQAFAYDIHNNDYKTLRFVQSNSNQHIDLYSLRSNSWVSLNDSFPPGLWIPSSCSGFSIPSLRYTIYDGCICIVVSTGLSYDPPPILKIIEFCLKDNSFRCDLPMPPDTPSHENWSDNFNLKNIQCQLTAFQFYHSQSKLKLWMLNEETRDWKSWMTISSSMDYELGLTRICDFMEPLYMNLDGQILVVFSGRQGITKLVLFDTKTSTRSVLGVFVVTNSYSDAPQRYLGQMTYIQSLVSPHLFEQNGPLLALSSKVRVAYQGVPGAYSEAAALKAYTNCETVPYDQFESAFKAVELLLVEKVVLPIENSVGGSIHRNYDLLLRHGLHIVGEVQLVVNHCLLGLPGVKKEEIKRVLSHPQTLDQCELALSKLGVIRVNADDSAGAAQMVADDGIREVGAVASTRAAEIYGLDILADKIQDDMDNVTRFLILAREPILPGTDRPYKTSIVFTLDEGPGILFKALAAFAVRDINLSKIESRPQKKRPLMIVNDSNKTSAKCFDYFFYIDFEASMAEPRAKLALAHLQEFAQFLRVLGCFPMDTQK